MALKIIKRTAFTILFLLGMVSIAWGAAITGVTMTQPNTNISISTYSSFTMSGSMQTGGGKSETGDMYFEWDQGTGTWTTITGSGALYTNDTNPKTGLPGDSTVYSITVTSDGTTGSYNVRVKVIDSSSSTYTSTSRTVTVNADTTPPSVSSTVPTDGADPVTPDNSVTINWNEAIDCTTVNTTNITISPSVSWNRTSCSGSQAVFAPSGQSEFTEYTVTVSTAVKDVSGNNMASAHVFSYTTGAFITCTKYVDCGCTGGSCGTSPYSSWGTAAASVTNALSPATSGDVVCVRARAGCTYAGFNMKNGVTVMAEDYVGLGRPVFTSTIEVPAGVTAEGSVLDGLEIQGASPSMRTGNNNGAVTDLSNNAIIRNMKLNGGSKPGIKHQSGSPVIGPGNIITGKARTAIRIYATAGRSTEAMIIKGNEFYGNGTTGGGTTMYAEIHLEGANEGRYVLIQDNLIHNNSFAGGFGIDESDDAHIYLTGNDVYSNPWGGFRLDTLNDRSGATHTGQITISGEPNFTFAGTGYTDGAPNKFHNNGRGGITTGVGCTMDIIRNEIYNNGWGGIHTGWAEPIEGFYTWPSTPGSAVLTIRKNKIYGNGTANSSSAVAGGGIDVLWGSGTIENNLVYGNALAGIRVGPGWNSAGVIRHNTVVGNGGGATSDFPSGGAGGGINYHDATDGAGGDCYDCTPHGTSPVITLKDNVITDNTKGAMRGMNFNNSGLDRDYNLVWFNNNTDIDVCLLSYPAFFCYKYMYGGVSPSPNDIIADPLYQNIATDDYRLTGSSPGSGAASDSGDMGAWGGTDPIDF